MVRLLLWDQVVDGLLLEVLLEHPEDPSYFLVSVVFVVELDDRDSVPPLQWRERRECECVHSVHERWQDLDHQVVVDDQCGLCIDRFLAVHVEGKFVQRPPNVVLVHEEGEDQLNGQNV